MLVHLYIYIYVYVYYKDIHFTFRKHYKSCIYIYVSIIIIYMSEL